MCPVCFVNHVTGLYRPLSLTIARAKSYPVFGGKQTLRRADPEDVIGLKVQAMVNDPARKPQELADIEALMRLYGAKLDWRRIQEYCDIFGIGEDFKRLEPFKSFPSGLQILPVPACHETLSWRKIPARRVNSLFSSE